MKVLNLYAGIGGNRKLWKDVEVTAVEYNEEIAAIYAEFHPNDKIVVGDAHQYLLDHFNEFDFIWTSPPCQTHSRTNFFLNKRGVVRYPDMNLYQEILFLQNFSNALWCVENVKSYYDPLIKPTELNRHYFWSNFSIRRIKTNTVSIGKMCGEGQTRRRKTIEQLTVQRYGIDLSNTKIRNKQQIIRNMVEPELGLHILEQARGVVTQAKFNQQSLFDAT